MIESIYLADVNGCYIAQFLLLGDDGILGFPTVAGFDLYQQDQSDYRWVFPGQLFTEGGFLGWIAGVAAADKGTGKECRLRRTGQVIYELRLTRTMSAGELAIVTGSDVGKIRQFLREHLTFAEVA